MGCCCRLLFVAFLLLLPAGLGDDSPESSLIPIHPPFLWGGVPVKPDSRDADVPTPAPGQPSLPLSTGPSGDGTSSMPLEGDGHNATTPVAALSPAPASVAVTDGPSEASSPTSVPPTSETAPAPRTADTATMDLGAASSPTDTAAPSAPSSLPAGDPSSPPTMALSPTPVLASPGATQPPLLTKDVPSLGTVAMASSLAMEPTSPPVTVLSPTEAEASEKTTGVTVEEVPRALSAGSIVAITVTVIVVVVLVFGAAAYLKIRHSSYGRLLDDHDYGSWGNYNNPLYDDS
ncbi:prostate androgen-regulated mucin-like protein 1 [Poecile atricapillus]|uniref:prostate androgen-regulated mucin-like protein 1 n=1 Tax=Poecile atricapillus TaxID=48891 RepID=UPI002738D26B|nr:prostate androgen-regulated mucin-like protein 1 [Poecile atricapillus]